MNRYMTTSFSHGVLAACVLLSLMLDSARADVFHMGGTRNPDGSWSGLASVEFVRVGNAGNVPDTRHHQTPPPPLLVGAVNYEYRIGKYEVTAGQYTEFLNAVAADDTYGLYKTNMDYDANPTGLGPNIKRSGSPGSYTYNVASDWVNRPANHVSFWDAARFANWLHNGQPTGSQGPGTTEDGAYNLNGYTGSDGASITRQLGARFFLPSEDEWYKAAYHDKSAGMAATYFEYPTGTNLVPGRDMTEATNPGNNANYDNALGSPYHRTEVGEFELSDSPYGTFDQGGNVFEWNDSRPFDYVPANRGVRGGSFNWPWNGMIAEQRVSAPPNHEDPSGNEGHIGFRVASVPEPSVAALGIVPILLAWQLMGRPRVRS